MRAFEFVVIFAFFALATVADAKKHPNDFEETNKFTDKKVQFSKLNRPFRMDKLNLIWTKAQSVSVLSDQWLSEKIFEK